MAALRAAREPDHLVGTSRRHRIRFAECIPAGSPDEPRVVGKGKDRTSRGKEPEAAPERERLLKIYRGWQRALREAVTPLMLRRSGPAGTPGLVSLYAFLFCFLEEPLWSFRFFTGPWSLVIFLAPRSGVAVVLVFLLVWAINAWLFHDLIRQTISGSLEYRRCVLMLIAVLAGFPQFGLCVLPAWRWIQKTRTSWVQRPRTASPHLALAQQERSSIHRHGSALTFFWVLGSGFLAWLLSIMWLTKRALDNPFHRFEILFLSLPLRLILVAILWTYFRSEAVRQGATLRIHRLALPASFTLLIPLPLAFFLCITILRGLDPSLAHSETLVWRALARRQEVSSIPLWLSLEGSLRHYWPHLSLRERLWLPPRSVSPGEGTPKPQNHILRLYDLQTFALVFDASILGWTLSLLGGKHPSWVPVLASTFQTLWLASLGFCGVGICLSAIHFVVILLRLPGRLRVLDRHPYPRYLIFVPLALAAGLFLGLSVQQGHSGEGGLLLAYLCAGLGTLRATSFVFRHGVPATPLRRRPRDMAHEIWLLIALPLILGLGGRLGWLPGLFAVWMAFVPVRAWLLGRALLPWLLRPFAPRDLVARDLPVSVRWQIGILSACALLPFGGLAIPLCIWVEHRKWQETARLAFKRQPC
jgi:hypothetical protein